MDSGKGGVSQDLMHQPHSLHGTDLAIVDGNPSALLPSVLDDPQSFA
jgi:hypothetical protein